jgi:hypothetical protein
MQAYPTPWQAKPQVAAAPKTYRKKQGVNSWKLYNFGNSRYSRIGKMFPTPTPHLCHPSSTPGSFMAKLLV